MKFAITVLALVGISIAAPAQNPCSKIINVGRPGSNNRENIALAKSCNDAARAAGVKRAGGGNSIIESLEATFNRDSKKGTPAGKNNPLDLNHDGIINAFEANAQAA
jgi:hypothetical protein